MPATPDEIKASVAALRQAEKDYAAAKDARAASATRIADLKNQLAAETKTQADLATKAQDFARAVEDAASDVVAKIGTAGFWTETGETVLVVDTEKKLRERTLNYLNGRPS